LLRYLRYLRHLHWLRWLRWLRWLGWRPNRTLIWRNGSFLGSASLEQAHC
jgi:hypothetical protein